MERRAGQPIRQAGDETPLVGAALLVVVGDPGVRRMLVRLLSRAGACVTSVKPDEPIDIAIGAALDAAICDGSSTAISHERTLRHAWPQLPLVLLDANLRCATATTVSIAKLDLVEQLLPALLSLLRRA